MKSLTLFSRHACHLCEDALTALERVRSAEAFDLRVVDLDREASETERAAYDHEVPVLELDGRKIMKYRIDEARLLRLLRG
jgi:glutaredoxin